MQQLGVHKKQEGGTKMMEYPKLQGLTWDGAIYENEEMGTWEALIPNGNYSDCPCPGDGGTAVRGFAVLLVCRHL